MVAGVRPSGWTGQADAIACWTHAGGEAVGAAGLHPWSVGTCSEDSELDLLARLLARRPDGLVALGELGLDFRVARSDRARLAQQAAFRAQLGLARAHNLPVVLHGVGADAELMRVLEKDGLPEAGGMVHGFTGSAEQARAWTHLGLHVSVGGPVTWRRSAKRTAGLLAIPVDRLLVESDAPDQPVARRGREPGQHVDVLEVLRVLGELRGVDAAVLGQQTADNARRLFGLDRAG